MVNDANLEYLFSLKGESITATDIYNLFNKKTTKNKDGSINIHEPMFYPYEEIDVPANKLENLKTDIKTRVGLYVFNLVILNYAFKDKIEYVNTTIRKKEMEKLTQEICDKMIGDTISPFEFGNYQRRLIWFNNFTEILIPGMTMSLIDLPKPIKDELQRLIDENKKAITENDTVTYLNNVEKPILDFAKKYYKENHEPGWGIYSLGGKPKFENTFKDMFLATGPIYDIASGKFRISTKCFSDGIDPKEYELYANSAISGAYQRACATAYGGAKVKEFAAAFQSLVVTEEDCGTTATIPVLITEDNMTDMTWMWAKLDENENFSDDDKSVTIDKGYILLTPNVIKNKINTVVNTRSPLMCCSDNFCWKCVGKLYKELNTKNIGFTVMKLCSLFLNKALKSMHDSTQKTVSFNPKQYFYKYS